MSAEHEPKLGLAVPYISGKDLQRDEIRLPLASATAQPRNDNLISLIPGVAVHADARQVEPDKLVLQTPKLPKSATILPENGQAKTS